MSRFNMAIVALFLIALLLWRWFDDTQRLSLVPQEELFQPTFTATHLRHLKFGPTGVISYEIRADYTEHYEQLEQTELNHPVIVAHNAQGQTEWRLSADKGILNRDDNAILKDDVKLENLDPTSGLDRLTTGYLELDLSLNAIRSNQKVSIDGPNFHSEGVGLRGQLDKRVYELLDKSHAIYFNRP